MIYKELVNKIQTSLMGNEDNKGYLFKLQELDWDKKQYEEIKCLIADGNRSLQDESQFDKSILDLIEWSSNFYGETLKYLQKQNQMNDYWDVWSDWVKAFGNEYKQS